MKKIMEDLVLGYGINQIGACNRDGSLNSFDISFKTKEEAEEYYNDIKMKVDYILLQMDEQLSKIIFNEYLTNKLLINALNFFIYSSD